MEKNDVEGRINDSAAKCGDFCETRSCDGTLESTQNTQTSEKNAMKEEKDLCSENAICNLVVDILRVSPWRSLNNQASSAKTVRVVHIPDSTCDVNTIIEDLDHILFERLMLDKSELTQNSVPVRILGNVERNEFVNKSEEQILYYLFMCFHRSVHRTANDSNKHSLDVIRKVIVQQTTAFLSNTDVYPGDLSRATILDLFDEFYEEYGCSETLKQFVIAIAENIDNKVKSGDEDINVFEILDKHFYKSICKRLDTFSVFDAKLYLNLEYVACITLSPILGKVFIDLNSPWKRPENLPYSFGSRLIDGMHSDIQKTLLGKALSMSCLPKPGHENFDYFVNASLISPQEHNVTSQNIATSIKKVISVVHSIFYNLLKRVETRNSMLNWIGLCLYAFRDRSKMWTNEIMMLTRRHQLSDGFLLNFGSVLLMLCQPFSEPFSQKLLKIDSRYCKSQELPLDHNSDDHSTGIHMRGLKEETFLVASESEDEFKNIPSSYNFMTEIFYCAHKALQIGFRSCHERFARMYSDLDQIGRVYEDARQQSTHDTHFVDMIRNKMEQETTAFLNLKAALLQPDVIDLMLKFNLATATWLNNLAVASDEQEASKGFLKIEVTEDDESKSHSKCLVSVPELVIDNISDIVIFLRRFNHRALAHSSVSLDPLMSLILVFMGSSSKMKNPHSRARLAEVLEALMPRFQDFNSFNSFSDSFSIGDRLFTSHPQVHNLVLSLLEVFVSIEMTGQSVAFEQKFQYRRPMYQVLKYLWTEVENPHKKRMKEISMEAERKIEDARPPLFLRFINLLTNDAIFLLDEALGYMKKLRELQNERSSGTLAVDQRQQNEANYQHVGRLARFHNVIGADTINTLSYITEEIKSIFCHPVIIHRIAAMLNYFLSHLVGPKQTDFKVKGMEKEFEFKPAEILQNICQIYINLGSKSNPLCNKFYAAVSNDARSYSPTLLTNAAKLLQKTGKVALAEQITQLGKDINKLSEDMEKEEIATEDISEDFLDPIMNTLMTDPVKLPSGYRVDRSTIARHLLNDQTDPFTRAPLTMEMVETDTELKEKIAKFMKDNSRV